MRKLVLASCLLALSQASMANDYLLNPATMSVGQSIGENLLVKESCPDPDETSCQEKVKYLSATAGRTGRIEFPVQLSTNFYVSINLDGNTTSGGIRVGQSITLYSGSYVVTLKFTQDSLASWDKTSLDSNNPEDTGGGGGARVNGGFGGWQGGYSVNDVRLIVIDGKLDAYINEAFIPISSLHNDVSATITLANPTQTYDKLVIAGIKDSDRLFEVKTGCQQASSCSASGGITTLPPAGTSISSTECMANYSPTGQLHVPCVSVPDAFGGTTVYDIKLNQQTGSLTFDLDIGSVKPR